MSKSANPPPRPGLADALGSLVRCLRSAWPTRRSDPAQSRLGRWPTIGKVKVAALAAAASTAAVAGLLDDGLPARSDTAGVPAPAVTEPAKATSYQLRCWQYGRLIFEERNLGAPPSGSRVALSMASASGDSAVQVFDMGNTTCLVQQLSQTGAAQRR